MIIFLLAFFSSQKLLFFYIFENFWNFLKISEIILEFLEFLEIIFKIVFFEILINFFSIFSVH